MFYRYSFICILITPIKSVISDLNHFSKDLDFSELDPTHDRYSRKNMKVIEE